MPSAGRGREGIYTAHELLESYRLTARNEIVGGSKHVRAAASARTCSRMWTMSRVESKLSFCERFPELRVREDCPTLGRPHFSLP